MTRRERLEQKLENRRTWAAGRDARAAALHKANEPYIGDHAFNTQPGHIPERARANARTERAFEHTDMANHHRSAAGGLAHALKVSVYSDDSDAPEALQRRIDELTARRAHMALVNKLYRAGNAAGLAAIGHDLDKLRALVGRLESWQKQQPYQPYELSNIGGRIQKDKERLKYIADRRERQEAAEAAGGCTITQHSDCSRVTFAEKPAREILAALRAASFSWSGGSWIGYTSKLPPAVGALAAPPPPAEPRSELVEIIDAIKPGALPGYDDRHPPPCLVCGAYGDHDPGCAVIAEP